MNAHPFFKSCIMHKYTMYLFPYTTHWSFIQHRHRKHQVSKFKRIGFEKMADFDEGESVSTYSIINLH